MCVYELHSVSQTQLCEKETHLLLLAEANHLHGGFVLLARVNFPWAVHQVHELRWLGEPRERAVQGSRSYRATARFQELTMLYGLRRQVKQT